MAAAIAPPPGWAQEVSSLEHSFLKVPHEQLCKTSKAAQALVEAEWKLVMVKLEKIKESAGTISQEQFVNEIDGLTTQLLDLKQQLVDLDAVEEEVLSVAEARIEHLTTAMECTNAGQWANWTQIRLDRIIADHLLRIGQYDVAVQLAQLAGIEQYVNLGIFETSRVVEQALQQQDCSVALAWCDSNRPRLTKLKSTLEFKLRLQQYIELVRQGDRLQAIEYAKRHLADKSERHMKDIQVAMSLLLFSQRPKLDKYAALFENERWEQLVQQFRRNNFALHSLAGQSTLSVCLQTGLSTLKNFACYESDETHTASPDCPVCTPHMNVLARNLPYAHHVNSSLVCGITGELMNEDNPPMSLPNGNVYSRDALQALATASPDGSVVCPRSHARFGLGDAQRVYIM